MNFLYISVIILYNIINTVFISGISLMVILYFLNINIREMRAEFIGFVQNNLVYYNCSPNLNNLYNFGFLLAIFMVIQILSGIIISIHYMNSNGFISLVYLMKDNLMASALIRLMHSMLPSFIHFFLVMHILRGLYYLSYIYTPNIYLSGVVLFILTVAISFLGYVLPFGQMSFWGASVITNIFALVPNLMELLLGNYVMCDVTLRRFYILHFVASLALIVVMLVHIIYLHKFGSTNPMHFNGLKVTFFPYFYAKDVYLILLMLLCFLLNYFNFVELSHCDNNVEANPLVTPLHIVPEWYFLFLYTVLKAINSKIAGLLLVVAFFILLINILAINHTTIPVWNTANFFLVMDWLAFYILFAFIGAKLPLAIYLYSAKSMIIIIYYRMFNTSHNYSNNQIMFEPYYTINGYAYYYTLFNIVLLLELSIINMNTEMNEALINTFILLSFVILSELLLFASFFGLLFNIYSMHIMVAHYHLYYTGLLILCHSALLQNVYALFILCYFFINLQILEYRYMAYTINYNIYTTLFYVLTTLHLLHILIGLYMVLFIYNQNAVIFTVSSLSLAFIVLNAIRQNEYQIVVNVYWNFVEILWLLIYFLYSFFNLNRPEEYGSLNHKVIGMNYFITSVYFGVVAILYSMIIRIELFSSGNRIIFEQSNFVYNYLISLHGLAMIFFFVMPIVFASVGNIYVPININAAELKLSKLNNLSLILYLLSFVVVVNASTLEFGIGVGWTLNPPLSTYSINLSKLSLELIMVGLLFNGMASLLSSINFFISLFYMANVYLVTNLTLYVVAVLLASYMLILSLPVLTCGFVSILIDIVLNTVLLDPSFGGDPLFYQHLFWFFGHPEVYIMILPSFGILNNFMQIFTAKIVFGATTMNLALVGITFLGFVVWAHHMYTTGLESDVRAYFTAVTIMISIPTGTKIFNWLCAFYCNYELFTNINIFILFFVFIFTVGGASGVMLGNAGLDIMLHDTYYVVGHFHQVLAIASVLSILLFVLVYLDSLHFLKVFGNANNSNLNFLFTNLFVNINLLFMNLLFTGFSVLPRRIPEYSDELVVWNALASTNALCVFILVFIYLL